MSLEKSHKTAVRLLKRLGLQTIRLQWALQLRRVDKTFAGSQWFRGNHQAGPNQKLQVVSKVRDTSGSHQGPGLFGNGSFSSRSTLNPGQTWANKKLTKEKKTSIHSKLAR
jgi:hypothetical protein